MHFLTAALLGTCCDVLTLTGCEVTLNQQRRMWRFLGCSYEVTHTPGCLQSYITVLLWDISLLYVWCVLQFEYFRLEHLVDWGQDHI